MNHLKVVSALALLTASACASTGPTPALVDARRAYQNAEQSEAQQLAPDRVLAARQALEAAERAHSDDPGSFDERSLSYVAQRKAELAKTYAALIRDEKQKQLAAASYVATQDRLRKQAEVRADSATRSLESTQNTLANTRGALTDEKQKVSAERSARIDAEQRANAAIESLRQVAQVKEEARGMVISLDGSVLFASNKSELLPIAQKKLDQVAESLKQVDADQKLVVEGYTDSRGADDANQRLSQQRADSVRTYLVSRGVKAEVITAVGRGEALPLADNETAEGRANNRRVEIIVQPKPVANNAVPPRSTTAAPYGQ